MAARIAAALVLPAVLAGCREGDTVSPPGEPRLEFMAAALPLDTARVATVALRNEGTAAAGPVALTAEPVRNGLGTIVAGAAALVTPSQISNLVAGGSRQVEVSVQLPEELAPGIYTTRLRAASAEGTAELPVSLRVAQPTPTAASVRILDPPASVRQGDVVAFATEARDESGAIVADPVLNWSVVPAAAGLVTRHGRFVGYEPGTALVVAAGSEEADTAQIQIISRGLSGSFSLVGHGLVARRFTSDLWLHGQHAYTGTWNERAEPGNTLYAWSIADPASPVRTDSVRVDARTVNDVKVSADGSLAVLTHEGSSDGANGITLLDLSDPAHPSVITRFTNGLGAGVHNVWIEDDFVYVVVDGPGNGLRIVDIADPAQPRVVASYYAGTSFLHDVHVRDGLAFLSHWDAGLVILDVGHGILGGSPTSPQEVSHLATLGGQTHNAWYWPARGYVFVGEEDYATPGIMHVVDVRDLVRPREVATFGVPGDPPHNFWLDEERGILYMAWYSNGLRALDVSGDLLGDLGRQGREIAFSLYGTIGGCPAGMDVEPTCTWAPQLHQGLIWISDMNGGLFSLSPSF